MTFTPTTPTTPGFYAWKENETDKTPAVWFIDDELEIWDGSQESHYGSCTSGKPFDGLWCRLVPAEEVEKAWIEGFNSDSNQGQWLTSRAKRVAEGVKD